jgi:hypothetical protein
MVLRGEIRPGEGYGSYDRQTLSFQDREPLKHYPVLRGPDQYQWPLGAATVAFLIALIP